MKYLYIGGMGMAGAMSRYGISCLLPSDGFPLATLLVNLAGCFLLELIFGYIGELPKVSKNLVSGLGTGFVGAFTTFSAFSLESVRLFTGGQYGVAAAYISVSLIGGLLAAWLGLTVSKKLLKAKGGERI